MSAASSSVNRKHPPADAAHLAKIADQSYQPIFVLGEHRSGTTILYKLLALSESFNIVTLYHTLMYDELLSHYEGKSEDQAKKELNTLLESHGIRNRIIDNMEVTVDYPDEYCFVLVTRTGRFSITDKNLDLFREFCRKIQYISRHERPLLLKNPFDYNNFLRIKADVPNARFIFIHRNPLDVLTSMLRAVRASWYQGNPLNKLRSRAYTRLQNTPLVVALIRWFCGPGSRVQPALRLMAMRIRKNSTFYMRNIEKLPNSDYVSVHYEDLCARPDATMERIFDFLGLAPDKIVDYQTLIQPRGLKRLPEIERLQRKLARTFGDIMRFHGFEGVHDE